MATKDSAKKTPSSRPSFAKQLFLGEIDEAAIFPFPKPSAEETETIKMVNDSIDKFMGGKEEQFRTFDREGAQTDEYLQSLKELGLFGLIIPEEFGGIGLSNTGYSRVLQQTSGHDASTSLTIGAHSSIGMKGILLAGTAEQKAKYLPKLASGEHIAAFCLTEPGSGSDAASIKTRAVKNADGSWTLTGEKIWITNGAFAEIFTVFAATDSPRGKMSAFIVERSFGGVTSGKKEDKLGIRASATTTVTFDNCKVPAANLLGEEGMGFKVAMSILNNGRTGLGGGTVGAMKKCINAAIKQATERKQFGRPIASFGLMQEKISNMAVNCFATESAVSMVAHLIDSGSDDYSTEAAISKIFASEALWNTVNDGLQIAGGNGFMKEYPYERVLRDSRINLIFEGTNEILRLYVGLAGLKDAGEYLKVIGKSAGNIFNDPIKGFGVLSGYAGKKLEQLKASTRPDGVANVHPALIEEGKVLQYYTVWLARASEAALKKFKKEIVEQQFVTKRLAEVSIDLFVGLCVLSRVTSIIKSQGVEKSGDEILMAQLFTQQAKRRMNHNLRKIERIDDELMTKLSKSLVSSGGYRWDTL